MTIPEKQTQMYAFAVHLILSSVSLRSTYMYVFELEQLLLGSLNLSATLHFHRLSMSGTTNLFFVSAKLSAARLIFVSAKVSAALFFASTFKTIWLSRRLYCIEKLFTSNQHDLKVGND